jgi:phospholipid/cholesterol/gamma-HCH transport system ATP-binding protein
MTNLADSAPPARAFGPRDHIVVERLEKRFGEHTVLRSIDMTIGRGDIAVIIGGSGAGKTTLLKILIGLERPTSGSIYVNGQDMAHVGSRELAAIRKKFGMVFQYSALLDSMNVLDNVAFPLREHTKLKQREIRTRVLEKLAALGLENVEHKFPSELSGGMRKRVGLARALMLEPEVIMYDEPTSGLDPLSSRLVDDMIVETRDRFGVTSIVISHDMTGALQIADQVYMLDKGRLAVSGSPEDLVRDRHELTQRFFDASGIAPELLLAKKSATPEAVEFKK